MAERVTTRQRGFAPWRPQQRTRDLLDTVQAVLAEYAEQLPLTLRQIFYRLVARHGFDKTETAYERLGNVLNRARRAQIISFDDIRDDSFYRGQFTGFADQQTFVVWMRREAEQFQLDRQKYQDRRLFLWCEARGMVEQLERVAAEYSVPVLSSGGFDHVGPKHAFGRSAASERAPLVLHIGDFDPSGVHMFSSLQEDVAAFCSAYGGDIEFVRLAVTSEQVDRLRLPTAPPKKTDKRSFDSGRTVQAEALDPAVLADIVRDGILDRISIDAHERAVEEEADVRAAVTELLVGATA